MSTQQLTLGYVLVTIAGLMFILAVSIIQKQIPWVRRAVLTRILIYYRARKDSERIFQPGSSAVQ